ncbi:MAG: DUF3224 domain-containing protein [Acidimicrobiia bacterium]
MIGDRLPSAVVPTHREGVGDQGGLRSCPSSRRRLRSVGRRWLPGTGIGGRRGTLVLQHVGTLEGGAARAALTVVSGTDELEGARGSGELVADPEERITLAFGRVNAGGLGVAPRPTASRLAVAEARDAQRAPNSRMGDADATFRERLPARPGAVRLGGSEGTHGSSDGRPDKRDRRRRRRSCNGARQPVGRAHGSRPLG